MTLELSNNPFLLIPEKGISKFKEKIIEFAEKLKNFVVNDQESHNMITSIYEKARSCDKELESERKKLGEPLRKQLSKINDKAKEVSDPLSTIISICNEKSSQYVLLLEKKNKDLQDRVREAEAMFMVEEPTHIEPVEKVMRCEGALSITKMVKKFRILDIEKVPKKYLMLDEVGINKAMACGIEHIEGLEIYEESKTTLRVR